MIINRPPATRFRVQVEEIFDRDIVTVFFGEDSVSKVVRDGDCRRAVEACKRDLAELERRRS